MSAPRLRTLLVDDELLARLGLRQALASHPRIEVVGECGHAAEALQAIRALAPDLLFLDISMPGMDGFRLLHRLSPGHAPMVVFVTAFAEHALRAFDADAIDYVLKPFDQARFDQAMARVYTHWQGRQAANTPSTADGQEMAAGSLQRIGVRVGEHLRVVQVADIDWIRADGNYVRIRAGGETLLHRETLSRLAATLDSTRFLRIHRAVIVNMERVREVHPLFGGNAEVILHDGTHLPLSRRFRSDARGALGVS